MLSNSQIAKLQYVATKIHLEINSKVIACESIQAEIKFLQELDSLMLANSYNVGRDLIEGQYLYLIKKFNL